MAMLHLAMFSPRMPTYNLNPSSDPPASQSSCRLALRSRQWRQYRLAMAMTTSSARRSRPSTRQRAAAGPDFTGYHVKCDFSEPHVHDLDKGGKQLS